MQPLNSAFLGVSTFCAASHGHDQCGSDGLPLTPNSIKIFGRFQYLKTISHPRLCQYIEIIRGKHERLMLVTEYYKDNLQETYNNVTKSNHQQILEIAFQVLDGLKFLNEKGIVHRLLAPKNILLDKKGHVKLSNYGMCHMTDVGSAVMFPIGYPKYTAPEVLAQGPLMSRPQDKIGSGSEAKAKTSLLGPKPDVWSLGLIVLEVCLGLELWSAYTLQQQIAKVLLLGKHGNKQHPLDTILDDHGARNKFEVLPGGFQSLLRRCLTLSVRERPTPSELLQDPVFKGFMPADSDYRSQKTMFQYPGIRCEKLELEEYIEANEIADIDHLAMRSIEEVYYLWGLAGGDLESELKKKGLIRSHPPICGVASVFTVDGDVFGLERDSSSLYDDTIIPLSLDQLRDRLQNVEEEAYYPLLEDEKSMGTLPHSASDNSISNTANLPLIIREKDIEYQFHRVVLYERLLKGYPHTVNKIHKEARVDSCPLFRNQIWAGLLVIEGDYMERYLSIDKDTPTSTDRQIEVDIPRCHQYSELLSSPTAHHKFKRILKAWVVSHPDLVYWQGLDSLCAPFLYLNFNNEALAYACLSAFIPKYLYKFFLKDNSAIIQEYLAVFSHLITFHDPELSNHMESIGFIPELYAIPWFLTMFAHVFPLHKLFHLWDTLLLGNSSFPLCIGVAILQQLRSGLLASGFNECILLFSDMPEVDIERCVKDSIRIFCGIPKSAAYRQHAHPPRGVLADSAHSQIKPVSYYSTDCHDVPRSELSREAMTLQELKSEKSPRISAEDLLELCGLRGMASRSPTKKTKSGKPMILIVDVRSSEDFARGQIPGSYNIPFDSAFSPEGDLVQCPAVTALHQHKGRVIVIVGNRGKNASNFATQLVRLDFPKVCVMHGGIDCLKTTGLLTVSSPDI
ncbi:TBC domain-containing protein kinase-like protein [Anneissia japonica]|uniref:TBC domain-containing protein kinase-like protein n=1 Tax=Anneissia japonica TaxID=1529436 RepID=UPI00142591EF|nr:TBC domain-containing protein kinase-like protein [Anneissia japonica]XP_033118016.1 TBC domain-containing protein kinase-like protein [Anneissia japonica]XP_033118017.1 TBC domain-containing protein kinase-like protein [Anneissia japonica]